VSDFRPDIWRLQANADIPGLTAALRNEDAGIRKRAAAALRALGAKNVVAELKAVLHAERDPETRAAILSALAALEGDDEDDPHQAATPDSMRKITELDRLVEQLNHPDTSRVIDAANKLGRLRSKRAVEPLVMVFQDNHRPSRVRQAAAEALLRLESAPVEVSLLGALRSAHWRVRRNGAAILGQTRAAWAIEPLVNALKDEHELVRRTAHAALIRIGTSEALAALKAAGLSTTGLKWETLPASPTAEIDAAQPAATPSAEPERAEDAAISAAEGESGDSTVPGPVNEELPKDGHQADVKHGPMPDVKTNKLRDQSGQPDMEPETDGRFIGDDEPTRPKRPLNLVWPKRRKPVVDPTEEPTKPLDPRKLDEYHRRMNKDSSDDR
jgi:hypothetical protein